MSVCVCVCVCGGGVGAGGRAGGHAGGWAGGRSCTLLLLSIFLVFERFLAPCFIEF